MAEASPIWVGQFDVAKPDAADSPSVDPSGLPYATGRVLARFHGEPLGILTVDLVDGAVDSATLESEARRVFADAIERISETQGNPSHGSSISNELAEVLEGRPPAVSVVIGTRNRPVQVVECVRSVLAQNYPSPVEVIVVDNGASDTATANAISAAYRDDDRVRYIHEPLPGLSRARNIGLAAARHPLTAFLSDDILVDPLWLLAIARGFGRDDAVRCVTGVCPPFYLDTAEQLAFESAMAWGTRQGFEPVLHRFDSDDDPIHPYRAGGFANGSNMVYTTEDFRLVGGFDESLGPGTKARGGEDLDAPIRILAGGGLVAFEPAAIGWHADRYDDRPFSQHMYSYGLGLTAFLAKHLLDRRFRRQVIGRIPKGFPLLLKAFVEPDEALSGDFSIPFKYHLWQLAGRIAGPFAYLAGRKTGPPTIVSTFDKQV